MERLEWIHEKMRIGFVREEGKLKQDVFQPQSLSSESERRYAAAAVVQAAAAGVPHGVHPGLASGHSLLAEQLTVTGIEPTDSGLRLHYRHEGLQLRFVANMEFVPGAAVVRQTTTVTNEGDEAVVLTHLSSLMMQGIGLGGVGDWSEPGRIQVRYARQAWSGEGQWRCEDAESLGLYRTAPYSMSHAAHWESRGSWSTGRYLPMVVVEDTQTGAVWYAQAETSSHWHIELGNRHEGAYIGNDSLYLQIDGASEGCGGWTRTLQPQESFTTIPAAIGCCMGGMEEAVRELTAYRRARLKPTPAWQGEFPVVFNDYMNGLWADPSTDKLVPLIREASELGLEVFCIDAGWFALPGSYWGSSLGDWQPDDTRFGKEGLPGMLRRIRDAGMIPGVWLELEVCGENAALASKPDEWFLRRNGKRVGGGERWFMNFSHPEVRTYMHGVIDRLAEMGVGFIKNDYNGCIGAGDDTLGDSAADGLIRHIRAVYSFLDEVRARHPGLIFEGCASGGMRADYGLLSHVHMVSSSDQEDYRKYPSVLGGMLAAVLPEQNGVWAYPYPLPASHRDKPELLDEETYRREMADGEQTVFNMINGFCGNLYLSGRIDKADGRNRALINEAVSLYKAERAHIRSSHPVWPLGFRSIADTAGWNGVGLASMDGDRIVLAVWRLDGGEETTALPIKGWTGQAAEVRQLYPAGTDMVVEHGYEAADGVLRVRLPERYQARLFELRKAAAPDIANQA
ncbi:glycoside hydrolase family 36 protein [Cohnella hashimotonis]|uniref:Alpha-galactosidase n=1 Tax=Cohnella hashimotonis TaxID=2826895 RepID=A0ABT6TL67_9BACL|nr:glycoside hydrolase family 36 protein [Cohnella hashimotonis]MDI4647003.1 alpha-galactosidase [Cohnella hashimotonis]